MPRGGNKPQPCLPAGPILRAILLRDLHEPRPQPAVWQMVHRARTQGTVPLSSADSICIRLLGLHPSAIYGEAWWNVIAA